MSTARSTITEEPSNENDTPDGILNSITSKDKELKRLLHEKQMLLARLLNIPQDAFIFSIHPTKPNTSLEAITYATTYRKFHSQEFFFSLDDILEI